MTFVEHFLIHTSPYESPASFWRWAAYTTIAAVARDNCWRKFGDHRIFPNIYTLILADSAVHRKGHPVKICEDLIKQVKNTKVISGRSSIQGILDELARGETDKNTGKLIGGGSAILVAPELSAGIVNDPEAVNILTDIYDFKEEYVSRLRGSGVFRIRNICLSMLSASNEELLKSIYDIKALHGGLLGRTFLILPNEFRPANSLFGIRDTVASFKELLNKLTKISYVSGEFEFTEAAQKAYENWYDPFRKSYKSRPDKSGITGRIHTSVLKIAMILCLDQTEGLIVDESHIVESIRHCTELLPNYSGLVMSSGKSTTSEIAAQLIEDIWKSSDKVLPRREFLSRYFHQFDIDAIDKCTNTLVQAGLIKEIICQEISFSVTEKCIKTFDLK